MLQLRPFRQRHLQTQLHEVLSNSHANAHDAFGFATAFSSRSRLCASAFLRSMSTLAKINAPTPTAQIAAQRSDT
eukprot:m.59709 g.59709  ORF g.59709 m.59709 type:complete len:75 (-) comp13605_c0_seq2:91-315(-)